MAQVLYRKYRSQDFSEILGQDSITKIIRRAIIDDKVAHAYLFNGPRGTGKTSLARILAKALNCKNLTDGNPCNKCENCIAINNAVFMDLIEIDAASNRGIDEIRDLKEKLNFMPVEGATKVYIIDEVHMLTTEAFNALLKTLEEPPKNVVFVLATTEVHKLPQTIISRTQRFDFKLGTEEQIKIKLQNILKAEKVKIDDDALDIIVQAGEGSFRDAETILQKVLSGYEVIKDGSVSLLEVTTLLGLAGSSLIKDLFEALNEKNLEKCFSIIQIAESEGIDFKQLVKQLLLKSRNELIKNIQGVEGLFTMDFLYRVIKELSMASESLKFTPVPSLPLEVAILNIVGLSSQNNSFVKGSVSKAKDSKKKKPSVDKKSDNKQVDVTEGMEETGSENKGVDENTTEKSEVSKVAESGSIGLDWGRVITLAKKENPHLAALLINAVANKVDEENVVLQVPFKFHQQRLEKGNTKKSLIDIIEKVFGGTFAITFEVNESLAGGRSDMEKEDDGSNASVVEEVFGDFA